MKTKITTQEKNLSTLFLLIFAFASITFFVIGIYKISDITKFNANSKTVTGKIVNVYSTRNGTHNSYFYKVDFIADDGNRYASDIGANIASVSFIGVSLKNVNDSITLRYDTLNPNHIEMDNNLSVWFLPLIFTTIGFILIIVSGRSILRLWRKN